MGRHRGKPKPPNREDSAEMGHSGAVPLQRFSFGFLSGDAGNAEKGEEGTLKADLAARRVVPLLEGVRAAAVGAGADRDCVDARSERNVCVGGRAFNAGMVSDSLVRGTQGGEQGGIGFEFAARTAAEQFDLVGEFSFGAVPGGFLLVADTGGDGIAKGIFE